MSFSVDWKCPKCKWTGFQSTGWDPLAENDKGLVIRKFFCPECLGKLQAKENKKKDPRFLARELAPQLIGTKRDEPTPAPTPEIEIEDDHESGAGADEGDAEEQD